jgi:hypothetical protein
LHGVTNIGWGQQVDGQAGGHHFVVRRNDALAISGQKMQWGSEQVRREPGGQIVQQRLLPGGQRPQKAPAGEEQQQMASLGHAGGQFNAARPNPAGVEGGCHVGSGDLFDEETTPCRGPLRLAGVGQSGADQA